MPKTKPKRARIYKGADWHNRYNDRSDAYINGIKDVLHQHYKPEFDDIQIEELVRCELELEELDRRIGNEDLDFASQHLLMQRRECRKSVFQYRNNLLLSMEKRVRNKIDIGKKVSKKDRLRAILAPDDDFTE